MKAVSAARFAGIIGFAMTLSLPAAAKYSETIVWSFGNGTDGTFPWTSLFDLDGTLYGTTSLGGVYNGGTVFALDPITGRETVLHSFGNGGDGRVPTASLIDVRGTLYGVTGAGGINGAAGTVFSLDPNTGTETVLYNFCTGGGNCTDGYEPLASLINLNGILYGTTEVGGSYVGGTVFAVNRKTGTEQVIYSFCSQQNCVDGMYPEASVISVNGTFYGTTNYGGARNYGTVFALDPNTGAETVLHSFAGGATDGQTPQASLINVNGMLYGTTLNGGGTGCGGAGCGTVFAINPNTGAEAVVHSFAGGTDGLYPGANLIIVKGKLFGTTPSGGTHSAGTVFAINLSTGAEKVIYSFCHQQGCADGEEPLGGLMEVNGTLYGTTLTGGAYGYGTVFALKKL